MPDTILGTKPAFCKPGMVAKNDKDYNMNEQKQHWVGIDVAKDTFDAALVFYGHHYSPEQIRKVPVKLLHVLYRELDSFLNGFTA